MASGEASLRIQAEIPAAREREEHSKGRKNSISQRDTSLSVILWEEGNVGEEDQSPHTGWGVFSEGTCHRAEQARVPHTGAGFESSLSDLRAL